MLSSPNVHDLIRRQAHGFLERFQDRPQLGRIFASHQKWLLAHLALLLYFENGRVLSARFFEQVESQNVASRNTADAFLKELEAYHILEQIGSDDRRSRPTVPSQLTLATVGGWFINHLQTLDDFDGGNRLEQFNADAHDIMARIHPHIARSFLVTPEMREQPEIFKPFVWLNNGSIIIDWMIANTVPTEAGIAEVPTAIVSIQAMAETFHLSRTHLTRKLLEAEQMKTIGWKGVRGRSTLWVSNDFRMEYARAQTVKLEIIDAAWAQAGLPIRTPDPAS
ncbi:hypothetical protein [Rhizobium paknamense]|uniref:AraC-like DNA-binding protein n=1 Tax=Rhizobium paknamense TaxID=1206817 RepID=A0ABU0I8G1_9HYPH|nr:hypothetical protein [Rhizobium paknamense]MDQ0454515.1 AraC-like DNA-binding protein [Rhizobium paknamense]